MENLKLKVLNEEESKEAQELLFKLGYGRDNGKIKIAMDFEFKFLFAYGSDLDVTHTNDEVLFLQKNHKLITIQELRVMASSQCKSKLFINGDEIKGCTVENFSINLGGSMKTKIEQAKSILSLNNKELSKLLGHHERYIDRVLREGVSLTQQKVIVKDIGDLLKVDELQCLLAKEQFFSSKLKERITELESLVYGDNLPLKNMATALGIAERDKRYMKRKLHDKSLAINWLLALNVFFALFLIGKCAGLV